jgi:hypothetical protein
MHRKLFATAAAAFIVLAGCHGLRAQPAAPAAADGTLGMALMYAAVASDGTLLRGSGVVSSDGIAAGNYGVRFERSIANCGYVATLVGSPPGVTPLSGSASATRSAGNSSELIVITEDTGGASASRPFHVMVFCPR